MGVTIPGPLTKKEGEERGGGGLVGGGRRGGSKLQSQTKWRGVECCCDQICKEFYWDYSKTKVDCANGYQFGAAFRHVPSHSRRENGDALQTEMKGSLPRSRVSSGGMSRTMRWFCGGKLNIICSKLLYAV